MKTFKELVLADEKFPEKHSPMHSALAVAVLGCKNCKHCARLTGGCSAVLELARILRADAAMWCADIVDVRPE